jgi:hypothetical protein
MADLLEAADGQLHTGLLAEKSATEVVLKIVGDKEVRVPSNKVASLVAQKNSSHDLTAEQAADLLEYLASLDRLPASGDQPQGMGVLAFTRNG